MAQLRIIFMLIAFIGLASCASNSSQSTSNHKYNKDNSGCFRECDERYSGKPERLMSCKKICRQFSASR